MSQIIRKAIQDQGPIPFARFMELALYCPKTGYYETDRRTIGAGGDYMTSVSVGDLLGRLLARRMAGWLEQITDPPLTLLEAGAHRGELARDILTWFQEHRPALKERLTYVLVEPSPVRQAWQKQILEPFTHQVAWRHSLEDIPDGSLDGAVYCNELLDAMPARRFGWDRARGHWFEWGVEVHGDGFRQVPLAANDVQVELALKQGGFEGWEVLREHLPDGFTLETCAAAVAWWREAARVLARGRLMTIDYGEDSAALLAPHRRHGTLRSYTRHHVADDPLARPGEQDLTVDVNFTVLMAAGRAAGLETEFYGSQEKFLTEIVKEGLGSGREWGDWTALRKRQFQTLTHPEHLGRAFRVLVQRKLPRPGHLVVEDGDQRDGGGVGA